MSREWCLTGVCCDCRHVHVRVHVVVVQMGCKFMLYCGPADAPVLLTGTGSFATRHLTFAGMIPVEFGDTATSAAVLHRLHLPAAPSAPATATATATVCTCTCTVCTCHCQLHLYLHLRTLSQLQVLRAQLPDLQNAPLRAPLPDSAPPRHFPCLQAGYAKVDSHLVSAASLIRPRVLSLSPRMPPSSSEVPPRPAPPLYHHRVRCTWQSVSLTSPVRTPGPIQSTDNGR